MAVWANSSLSLCVGSGVVEDGERCIDHSRPLSAPRSPRPSAGLHLGRYTYSVHVVHVNSFKETRQSKQLRPKTTPFFLERKNELPRAGFEPATFCVLGERSTN